MDQLTPEMARAAQPTGEKPPVNGPIVVGISDAPLSEQRDALEFAVAEANRRGSDLWLVHGTEALTTLTAPAPTTTVSERFQAGEEILQVVGDYAKGILDPALKIAPEVIETTSVEAIVDLTHVASLVVCGRRVVSAARRWHTGSTTSRVCAQSHAPVAVVKPGIDRTDVRGVIVGVDGHGHSSVAIETAFAEAALRDQDLLAVHAWEAPGPPGATGYVSPGEEELAMLRDQAKERLAQVMAGPSADHPAVEVSQRVVRGAAAAVLVEASQSADLLVVGRHAGHAVASVGLGSVARHVLGDAQCPVIVTPPSRPAHRFGGHSGAEQRTAAAGQH